ncbi:hypothetical protein ACFFRR_005363 [Megaselia abdita]
MFLNIFYMFLAIHSNGAIKSDSTMHSLELCGSFSCNKITSVYDKPITKMINLISIIPIGALELDISEIEPSSNVLLLKSLNDSYIINGEESQPGLYHFCGDTFLYTIEDNLDKITSKGPLKNAFNLMLQGNFTNKGIRYSYKLPTPPFNINISEESEYEWNENWNAVEQDKLRTLKKKRKFNWLLVGFGPCTKTCGPGFRAPIFRCTKDLTNKYYTPKRCSTIDKPLFNDQIYKCNLQNCAPYWKTVDCVKDNAVAGLEKVTNNDCAEVEPLKQKLCECIKIQNTKILPIISNLSSVNYNAHMSKHQTETNLLAGTWMASNWSDICEDNKQEGCAMGIQHRTVVCDRSSPNTNLCDSNSIPSTFKFCKTNKDCSKGEWYTSGWSNCIGDCFNLTKHRLVMCIQDNNVVADERCDIQEKPAILLQCKISDVNFCGPRWHYSEWSECSKLCGDGIQKRVAKCYEVDKKLLTLKISQNCKYKERQTTVKSCFENKCDESELGINTEPDMLGVAERISCVDDLPNCKFIDKVRLCALKYYSKKCCFSCLNSN